MWLLAVALGQGTLYGMNLDMVACDADTVVGIELEDVGKADRDLPHVVSFMRAPGSATSDVSFDYVLKDANGVIVKSTCGGHRDEDCQADKITLPKAADSSGTCQCLGNNGGRLDAAKYGADYGKTCAAHDNAKCGELFPGLTGAWCCDAWCYVDESCTLTKFHSTESPGMYYSYAACAESTAQTTAEAAVCNWDPSDCSCTGNNDHMSAENKIKYGEGYGTQCGAWDAFNCDIGWPTGAGGACAAANLEKAGTCDAANSQLAQYMDSPGPDLWCCSSWCYTTKSCSTAEMSWFTTSEQLAAGTENYFTYLTCDDDMSLLAQCPYKASTDDRNAPAVDDLAAQQACKCKTDFPDGKSPLTMMAGFEVGYEGYGVGCGKHDSLECDRLWPMADTDTWCCDPWCYVEDPENCPSASPSTKFAGYAYSYLTCEAEEEADPEPCPFNKRCRCTGDTLSATDLGDRAPGYGTDCRAHDNNDVACTPCVIHGLEAAGFNGKACCENWCYVGKECYQDEDGTLTGDAFPSFLSSEKELFYSYTSCLDDDDLIDSCQYDRTCDATCEDSTDPAECNEDTCTLDSCPLNNGTDAGASRMLEAELDEELDGRGPLRRLAARRRSGGSSSSSSRRRAPVSSSRRRAPPPSDPRRRSPSESLRRRAPSTTTEARRRSATSSSTAGTARRRGPSSSTATKPTVDQRRRAPPVDSDPRRRANDGTADRRRVTAADDRRRRGSSGDVTGNSWTQDDGRRRSAAWGGSDYRRRASYGYTTPQSMTSNLGPSARPTNVGYQGKTSSGTSWKTKMVGAAVGGAVVGGAVGYMAGSSYGSDERYYSSTYRRRGYTSGNNGYYPGIDEPCTMPGSRGYVDCDYCRSVSSNPYECRQANECWSRSGCDYVMEDDYVRDDVLAIGFAPEEYTFPLTLELKAVTGLTCPAPPPADFAWAQVSRGPDLFLALTPMGEMYEGEVATCDTLTGFQCASGQCYDNEACNQQTNQCECAPGFCWNQNSETCLSTTSSDAAPTALALLLAYFA